MYVQIDDSLISKKICRRKNSGESGFIDNGVKDEVGNIFMVLTTRKDGQTFVNIIIENVEESSIIITDRWMAYRNIERHNFIHEAEVHSKNFVKENRKYTNLMEHSWVDSKKLRKAVTNKKR